MPKGWPAPGSKQLHNNQNMTLTQLKQRWKNERIPSISYDIDGDGAVSQKDYFLATKFDSKKAGHLSTQQL